MYRLVGWSITRTSDGLLSLERKEGKTRRRLGTVRPDLKRSF